jgi:hypothetical protein
MTCSPQQDDLLDRQERSLRETSEEVPERGGWGESTRYSSSSKEIRHGMLPLEMLIPTEKKIRDYLEKLMEEYERKEDGIFVVAR